MIKLLAEHLPDAATHHSGLDREEREEAALCFTEGSPRVMLTTSGLSAGIDFANVEVVINVDTPYTLFDFAQDSGRPGRRCQRSYSCVISDFRRKMTSRISCILSLSISGLKTLLDAIATFSATSWMARRSPEPPCQAATFLPIAAHPPTQQHLCARRLRLQLSGLLEHYCPHILPRNDLPTVSPLSWTSARSHKSPPQQGLPAKVLPPYSPRLIHSNTPGPLTVTIGHR